MNARNIKEEIQHKIETLDKTRTNRIIASQRLYAYSNKWDIVFFYHECGSRNYVNIFIDWTRRK
ncbi:Uncharacterised protein [Streptococcus suis]|nr:Uncharacterised protein [Streptococcus suis]CYU94297.1 Uncharacterised protein [Streptococcus suis]